MQDRFKFRWFSKLHKKVFDVVGLEFPNFVIYKDEQGNEVETGLSSDNGELIQCTGLKDKNGNLIYEEDIVKTNKGKIYYIAFDKKTASFREEEAVKTQVYSGGHHLSLWAEHCKQFYEVIGNIYETPKLLETY